MSDLSAQLATAVADGNLLAAAQTNIEALLAGSAGDLAIRSVTELAERGEWAELNDRFFKTLAFGTGGLRGRTIGRVVSSAEQGAGGPNDRPEHPCVGTATMNFY